MRWNILNRFLAPTLLTVILGMGVVISLAYTSAKTTLQAALVTQITQLSEGLSRQMQDWLEQVQADVIHESEHSTLKTILLEPENWQAVNEANQLLTTFQKRYQYTVAAIVDAHGLTRAASAQENVGQARYDDREYFKRSLIGDAAISEPIRSRTTGEPVVAFSAPVKDGDRVIGVFLISISMMKFSEKFITPLRVGEQGYSYVLGADGTFLAHPERERILDQKITDFDFGQALMAKRNGLFQYVWKGVPKEVFLSSVPKTGWVVAVGADLRDLFSPIDRLRQTMIVLAIAIIAAISLVISLVVRSLVRPIVVSVNFAKAIADGNIHAELHVRRHDEIGMLADALRNMKTTIQHALRETDLLSQAIQAGQLGQRGHADHFSGAWRDLIVGVNNVIDAFMTPFQMTANCVKRIAKGDIPSLLDQPYQGEFNDLQQHVNALIQTMNEIADLAEEIADGNLSVTVKERSEQDRLMKALNGMIAALNDVVVLAEKLAEGDLTVDVRERSEHDRLMAALNAMVTRLHDIIVNAIAAAQNVADGSQQMSLSAQQVAEGATEQSTAVEQASASMQEMAANIRQNAENALQTEKIASKSAEDARESGKSVAQTVQAMQQIARKIVIVEEIASQTRLLSLNATIEAARAQDHGKGFAVVASEVRALAQRSHEAAEEINELARSSVSISGEAGAKLAQLVPDIQRTSELVLEISAASNEQSSGSAQINNAIQQLDQVIQRNTATAEQMASMAEQLASQAKQLQFAMTFFKVKESWNDEAETEDKESEEKPVARDAAKKKRRSFNENGRRVRRPALETAIKLNAKESQIDELDEDFERF